MGKKPFSVNNIFIAVGLIVVDLAVYIFLGLLLMNYDDFYDESEGPYWSLESMTTSEKITYIGLNIWHVINLIVVGIIVYKTIKFLKDRRQQHRTM